ncbi:MAG: hypothetical protein M3Q48_00800 [Actinomycetota bacterium]|nr:hypothetical protein [Actinomycetota bacterium]
MNVVTDTGTPARAVDGAPEDVKARLVRGAVAGALSGAAFIAVTMWFATTVGDPAKGPLMMISTIAKGDAAMAAGTADPTVGVLVHLVLSVVFGMLFGLIAPMLRTNAAVALAGTAYGALLYLVNFKLIAPLLFPIFGMANQPFELVVHIVFGVLVSFFFFSTGVRRSEPLLSR